jgi:hypothetical protein
MAYDDPRPGTDKYPIGTVRPDVANDDLTTIDIAVNDNENETYTDRGGKTKKTFWGIEIAANREIQRIGGFYIGVHTTGLEYTSLNDYSRSGGVLYRVKADAELPYVATSNDPTSELDYLMAFSDSEFTAAAQEQSLGAGYKIYPREPDRYISVGSDLEAQYDGVNITHIRILNSSTGTIQTVRMVSAVSGLVSDISDSEITAATGTSALESIIKQFNKIADVDGNVYLGESVRVKSYYGDDMSGELFFNVVASGTGTDDGGSFIDLPTSGLQLMQYFNHPFNVRQWGAKIDGTTDDTQAWINAWAYAQSVGGKLTGGPGTTIFNGDLDIDLSLSSLELDNCEFNCVDMTGDHVFNIFSSTPFPSLANSNNVASGFRLVGPQTAGKDAILFGGDDYEHAGQIAIDDWAIRFFDVQLKYLNNSWRIFHGRGRLENPLSRYIEFPSTLLNSGEIMAFDHLMMADGNKTANIDKGQWNFNNTSILNATLQVNGDATVNLFGPNLENPGGTEQVYYMLRATSPDAIINIYGGRIVINNPTGGVIWDQPPFQATDPRSAITMHGMRFPAVQSFFQPLDSSGNYAIVEGSGRVVADAATTFSNFEGLVEPVFNKNINRIRNGGAGLGTTSGWTVTPYGAPLDSTITASAAAARTGSFGFLVQTTAGGVLMTQDMPCNPGQLCLLNVWYRIISNTIIISLKFLDLNGNLISQTTSGALSSPSGSFQTSAPSNIAPVGTSVVRVEVNGQPGAGESYVDDIILNVV